MPIQRNLYPLSFLKKLISGVKPDWIIQQIRLILEWAEGAYLDPSENIGWAEGAHLNSSQNIGSTEGAHLDSLENSGLDWIMEFRL